MKRKNLIVLLLAFSSAWFGQIIYPQTMPFDESDGFFEVVAQTMTVMSPNGGENWKGGEMRNITWTSSGSITSVNIDHSQDGGVSWIATAANIANTGGFAWRVPFTSSTLCLVRVRDAANASVFDVSDAHFTILPSAPAIIVTSPNGGEQWQRRTSKTIRWISSGVARVKIQLIKGTIVNSIIASSVPAATGSYTWTIPAAQAVGTNYKIRIISTSSPAIRDSSDASFTIFAPKR